MTDFVHLHLHTEYSLLDGACRISGLFERAASLGQKAAAISDHGALYGVIDFYKAAKAAGIKPIIGCEVYVAPRTRFDKTHDFDAERYHLVLLCENQEGYRNLVRMVSASYTEGFYVKPRVDKELLRQYHGGLIALSACMAGEVPRAILARDMKKARERAEEYIGIFGKDNFFLEIQDHEIPEQKLINQGIYKLSQELEIPLVATNDAHYLTADDAEAQDVLMCIQMGKTVDDPERLAFQGKGMYVKSGDEMAALFPQHPEALSNTVKIAERCNVEFEFGVQHLPKFQLPEGEDDALSYLRKLCEQGYSRRYATDEYRERLDYELAMISQMGYVDYFLIVGDFIAYAKDGGIPVGPGRGSAAASIVSYCLNITDVDPMRYALYFERFLNPDRVSMPDIDIDFCVRRRQEVIDYVVRKYGADHVAQIVTFGTMAARAAVRDVGRALNYPYAEVDVVAKLIPFAVHMTIERGLEIAPRLKELYDGDPRVARLIDMARKVEGLPRHASTHAAGVLITAERVDDFVPLARNDESIVTQFPMTTLEELGLLKMDFLGLRNLTIIHDAVERIRENEPDFSLLGIPEDDEGVYQMISDGKTSGVFQLESSGMTGVCVGLRPRNIEDISSVVALYRPGPMASIPMFIDSKHHPERVKYKHPILKETLEVTYGCIVYQEQVLEIMRRVGGFSLGHADLVRRAMSKKKYKELEREREAFIGGALKNDVDAATANSIFDEVMDFANYAFNKAHSVCYAVIAYQTAYLKYHYPREYMAALLTSVLDWTGKVAEYIAAAKEMGIEILPPDVNKSRDVFSADGGAIRFGLVAVKNIGQGVITALLKERRENGEFKGLRDFCERMYVHDMNKRALESLINCGALDGFGRRSQLSAVCGRELEGVAETRKRNVEGQIGMFGMEELAREPALPDIPEYPHEKLLELEKETCGLYFSGHPMDGFANELKAIRAVPLARLTDEDNGLNDNQVITVAGLISHVQNKTTRNNSMMAYVTLEDATGGVEVLVFSGVIKRDGAYIAKGAAVSIRGKYSEREDKEPQIVADELRPLGRMEAPDDVPDINKIFVKIPRDSGLNGQVTAMLSFFKGNVPVVIFDEGTGKRFGGACEPRELLLDRLKKVVGGANVVIK